MRRGARGDGGVHRAVDLAPVDLALTPWRAVTGSCGDLNSVLKKGENGFVGSSGRYSLPEVVYRFHIAASEPRRLYPQVVTHRTTLGGHDGTGHITSLAQRVAEGGM